MRQRHWIGKNGHHPGRHHHHHHHRHQEGMDKGDMYEAELAVLSALLNTESEEKERKLRAS